MSDVADNRSVCENAFCPAQVIAPTRAFAKHKASRQAGSTKSPKQIIPARQRVLSKLGLTHNKSLKHLVRIRPAKAVQPQAIRHAHNIRQAPGQHLQPAPRASATAERPANNDQSKDTVSPQRGLSVQQSKLQHDPVRGQAQRDRGATAAEDMQQSVAQPGLVEADIDWLPSATSSQTFADHHALQPVAEQPWTVQYLEEGMQHDHRGRLASKSALECIVEADKSPCNNDTFAWMEDDIPW